MDWSMHWPGGLTAEAKLLGVSAYPESAPHFTPPLLYFPSTGATRQVTVFWYVLTLHVPVTRN